MNRHQGKRFVSIRSNRIELTTFSATLYRPGTLYFLRLAQIDFRHNESTAGEAIRVDSTTFSTHPVQTLEAIFSKPLANRLPA